MAGNTLTTQQLNQTFTTGVVNLVVGVLNPPNSPQSVWDCGTGFMNAIMTTAITGGPATVQIVLEGTYDGINWTVLATSFATGGENLYAAGVQPFTNLRARCVAVSGGASPTVNVYVTVFGTQQYLEGTVVPVTNLFQVAANTTGAVADFAASREGCTFQVVTNGTITAGAVTFLGSIDGVTYIPLTAAVVIGSTGAPTLANGVLSMTAATTALVNIGSNTAAIRFFRADVTTPVTGGGGVSVKVQAF